MSVLLTGATGFIGRPLVEQLSALEGDVHAISRGPAPEYGDRAIWHVLDIGDQDALASLIEDVAPERLVHLAWYVEHGRFWSAAENLDWVGRSLDLLRSFVAAGGQRAVLLGTCAEYDWSRAEEPLDELASPVAPASLYGTAKDALRRVAESYADGAGIELAWARPFFFYGPHESPGRLVPAVIRPLLSGKPVETTEGGQRRDFMHVEDVAGGIAALLDSSVVGPVNVATGEAVAVADVVGRIASLIGRPELIKAGSLPSRPEPPLLVAETHRLRDEVGFSPRWGLQDGLEATIRWWADELGRA
jgi:nucleoside-diphosphate-sugar epimerase